MKPVKNFFLHHQLALLALHDSKGTFGGTFYEYAFAGGMVSELLLQKRISVSPDDSKVDVVLNEPLGDEVVDELLKLIAESGKRKNLKYWVQKGAGLKNLKHRIAAELCDLGIVEQDERKILWVFTQKTYPEVNGAVEDELRAQMADVMFGTGETDDVQTAVLIALAKHSNLLKDNFAKVELDQHAERIKELANGENLAAGATKAAIEAVQAAVMVATMVPVMVAATSH